MKKALYAQGPIKKTLLVISSIIFLLFLALPITITFFQNKQETQIHAAPAGFVYRNGKTMMLNGATYKFVGFNAYGMTGCETGTPWNQTQIDAYFQSLPPGSMTRIWAFQTRSQNLDLVVQRAEANNQKLVMTLGNGLKNCEEAGDTGAGRGADWFSAGYKTGYLDWVKTAVAKYKASPAVGMWEVSNEGGHPDGVSAAIMKAYYDVVSAAIKAIDPDHLVSTGALAEYTYGGTAGYQSIHDSPNIDVISFHEYDGTGISSHFSAAQSVSNSLNKPIMVGETGVTSCDPERATQLKAKFDGYLSGGASGVLLWNRSLSNGSCGFNKIGPTDAASTMVKNYLIPGVVLTQPAGGTTAIPTPQGVSPTFYCGGGCPVGTVNPTLPGGTQPTSPVGDATNPPGQAVTQPVVQGTLAPCEQSVQRVARRGGKHKHRRGGNRGGLMGGFMQFLIQLINQILQMLGLPPLNIPTDPGGQNPQPTQTPGNPGQPQPTTPQPCATQQPQPTQQQPTQQPTTPVNSTIAPTVAVQPTTKPNTSGGTSANVEITFYGAWDNDPAGSTDIANPVIHQKAGGVGSYADPLTFASPAGNGAYKTGQIIYVPLVQKYFIKEDECAVSWTAPNGCGVVSHVDLYVGNPSATQAVIACEESLTPGGNAEIIIDPPSTLTYDPTPIWSDSTGKCMSAH